MLFLFVLLGAAVFAVVLWRTLKAEQMVSDPSQTPETPWSAGTRPARPRASGPDDDPEFLKQLDEKVRGQEDPPATT
ncbi:hypothetical protein EV383_5470 [Pseudonocardia sediminis]|uniref:Uncharacterized protein n=1 Tax=Pseudonocardia sediminis TaxID=1397368 RepID=A0A4Q7V1X3_PSEST|nr:hypothetical protein [Pseudonocardia sediminis]RZT88527.1 hypothetical protein EV383_5470 [Pseudonocardia sediminis]